RARARGNADTPEPRAGARGQPCARGQCEDQGHHRRARPPGRCRQNPRERRKRPCDREEREGVQPPSRHAAPMARSAQGKRAAVRRGNACSTDVTRAKVTALSPKSDTKLPKKHAPRGGRPSALPSAVVSAMPPVVVHPKTK